MVGVISISLKPESKFSLSLNQLILAVIFIVTSTFSASLIFAKISQSSKEADETKEQVKKLTNATEKISNVLEIISKDQSQQKQDIISVKEDVSKIKIESVLTNSYIQDLKGRRK